MPDFMRRLNSNPFDNIVESSPDHFFDLEKNSSLESIEKILDKYLKFQRTFQEIFGYDICKQSQELSQELSQNRSKFENKSITHGSWNLREQIPNTLFYPNFQKFIEFIHTMKIWEPMLQFATDNQLTIQHNIFQQIFEKHSYILESPAINSESREWYILELINEGDIMEQKSSSNSSNKSPKLNPLIFKDADAPTRISLKLLDNLFAEDWLYGSSLEVWSHNIYDTDSDFHTQSHPNFNWFIHALFYRCEYIRSQWENLSIEDKIAWTRWSMNTSFEAEGPNTHGVSLTVPNKRSFMV